MKNRIKEYIDLIFADAPDCAKTREAKEEMYANVCDRYDDLISEGKSESAAYNISISGIGDISELIEEIKGEQGDKYDFDDSTCSTSQSARVFTAEEKEEIEKYRVRRGVMNSVAIALYILCWVPLVLLSSMADVLGGNAEVMSSVGLAVMMLMVAAATVLMVMKSSIKPLCLKGVKSFDDDEDDGDEEKKTAKKKKAKRRKNPALHAISTLLWTLTLVAFLTLGFTLGAWHPAWMLFVIAAAVENVIEAIFELTGKKYL